MARSKALFVDVLGLDTDVIAPLSAEIWAGLAFDNEARAALKRDGLMLDGLRLTGPMPFTFTSAGTARVRVIVPDKNDSDRCLTCSVSVYCHVCAQQQRATTRLKLLRAEARSDDMRGFISGIRRRCR